MNNATLELIDTYNNADCLDARNDAFAELLYAPEISSMVRRQTKRFEARGLFDAQSIIYVWIFTQLEKGNDLHEGALVNHLRGFLGSVGMASVSATQHSRYRGAQRRISSGVELEEAIEGKLSLREYEAIYRVDASSAVALDAVNRAPDLQAAEEAELAEILELCGSLFDDDTAGVFQYRYWLDETANLSWERVAEEMSSEAGWEKWSRKSVSRLHAEGIELVRAALGLAA